MPSELYGLFAIISLFILLASGIHVGIALGLVGFFGLLAMLNSLNAALGILTTTPYYYTGVWALTVIPLFVIMGVFSMHAGISRDVFDTAHKWLGRLPGGLAIATIAGNAGFGALCGSSLVSCVVFTKISFPEMLKHGYDKKLASGAVAAGGMLGMLIPPSNAMIVYGILSEQSVGHLLIAGIGPGLLLGALFSIACYAIARRNPVIAPRAPEPVSFKDKVLSIKGTWGVLVLAALIIGGIYTGVFSPTEAGATGAMGAFLLAIALGKLTWKNLGESMREAARVTAMLFLILVGAGIFSRFLAMTGLPGTLATWLIEAELPKYALLAAFLLMYILLGCFLDGISMLSITLPIIHPIIMALGWNPIWFAVLVVLSTEIGLLTPPLGIDVYAVKATAGDVVTLEEVFRGCIPFFFISILCLVILAAVPQITIFLPENMMVPR